MIRPSRGACFLKSKRKATKQTKAKIKVRSEVFPSLLKKFIVNKIVIQEQFKYYVNMLFFVKKRFL